MAVGEFLFGKQSMPLEVLDLRHFGASQMEPLLRDEAVRWQARLRWDYSKSIDLLLEYLDGRVLPGFVAARGDRVEGYTFGVLEGVKAVIGDVYAFGEGEGTSNPLCDRLLEHLIEMLQATPGVDRIESQLLMFPGGALQKPFLSRGFRAYPRLFMMGEVAALEAHISESRYGAHGLALPKGLRLLGWKPEFYDGVAELIHRCYVGHIDSGINDQYCSVGGALRFLHNIIRFPGCGVFDAENSWILRDESGVTQAVLLSSRVRQDVSHVTQVCVAQPLRGLGLGKLLLQQAAREVKRRGGTALSLTVTEANLAARRVYDELGYVTVHRFEAMVWDKSR